MTACPPRHPPQGAGHPAPARRMRMVRPAGRVETHQVRKLADLTSPGQQPPPWAALMAKMRRKTLIVCAPCHQVIHGGKPAAACT